MRWARGMPPSASDRAIQSVHRQILPIRSSARSRWRARPPPSSEGAVEAARSPRPPQAPASTVTSGGSCSCLRHPGPGFSHPFHRTTTHASPPRPSASSSAFPACACLATGQFGPRRPWRSPHRGFPKPAQDQSETQPQIAHRELQPLLCLSPSGQPIGWEKFRPKPLPPILIRSVPRRNRRQAAATLASQTCASPNRNQRSKRREERHPNARITAFSLRDVVNSIGPRIPPCHGRRSHRAEIEFTVRKCGNSSSVAQCSHRSASAQHARPPSTANQEHPVCPKRNAFSLAVSAPCDAAEMNDTIGDIIGAAPGYTPLCARPSAQAGGHICRSCGTVFRSPAWSL